MFQLHPLLHTHCLAKLFSHSLSSRNVLVTWLLCIGEITVMYLAQKEILKKVKSKWRQIGDLLGQHDDLDSYARKYFNDDYDCCSKVFEIWINNAGHDTNYSVTIQGLRDLLCAVDLHGIVIPHDIPPTSDGDNCFDAPTCEILFGRIDLLQNF